MSEALLLADNVSRSFQTGTRQVDVLRRYRPAGGGSGVDRHRRRVWGGQIDTAASARWARSSGSRHDPLSRGGAVRRRELPDRISKPSCGLHLPVSSPAPRADGTGKRRDAVPDRAEPGSVPRAGNRTAGSNGVIGPSRSLSRHVVRRRAAAGGHCTCRRQGPVAGARRRANRQSRSPHGVSRSSLFSASCSASGVSLSCWRRTTSDWPALATAWSAWMMEPCGRSAKTKPGITSTD